LTEFVNKGISHYRIFDPGVSSPNLIRRVQWLAFHERHRFNIIKRLLTGGANLDGGEDVRR
jgi:hypothetical protein